MKLSSILGIFLWGNTFTAISRLKGITATVKLICRIGESLPLAKGDLGTYSNSIDLLLERFPFLFLCRKQHCLLRGLLLYFFGKRLGIDIRLHFGSKKTDSGFDTHCWIAHGRQIQFEVEKVIKQYTRLIEYR